MELGRAPPVPHDLLARNRITPTPFYHAESNGALQPLHQSYDRFKMSLYADDAIDFINPTAQDQTNFIFQIFGECSGLIINMEKTVYYPIRCQNLNIEELLGTDTTCSTFPCTYLGLPLHYKKMPKSAIQPMVQKIGNWLPSWKRPSHISR
jgi:hypothetical protein